MWSLIDAITGLINVLAERNTRMSELDDILTTISANLATISDQLTKGFDEITAKIAELTAAASTGETVDPATLQALQDQVTALAGQAQALDDIVPDTEEPPA